MILLLLLPGSVQCTTGLSASHLILEKVAFSRDPLLLPEFDGNRNSVNKDRKIIVSPSTSTANQAVGVISSTTTGSTDSTWTYVDVQVLLLQHICIYAVLSKTSLCFILIPLVCCC